MELSQPFNLIMVVRLFLYLFLRDMEAGEALPLGGWDSY